MKFTAKSFAWMLDISTLPAENADWMFSSQQKLVANSKKYGYRQIYGHPYYFEYLKRELAGTKTGVSAAIGSYLCSGAERTEVKVFEASAGAAIGIDEFDMWINIPALLNKDYNGVRNDIIEVRKALPEDRCLKVIIETPLLTSEQIRTAVALIVEAGADFVKSGSGRWGVCTLQHAETMTRAADGRIQVKCAGSIRDLNVFQEMVDMGVTRFGTSLRTSERLINLLLKEEASL